MFIKEKSFDMENALQNRTTDLLDEDVEETGESSADIIKKINEIVKPYRNAKKQYTDEFFEPAKMEEPNVNFEKNLLRRPRD